MMLMVTAGRFCARCAGRLTLSETGRLCRACAGVVIRILRGLWRRREDLHRVGVALAAVGFVLWMIDGRQWALRLPAVHRRGPGYVHSGGRRRCPIPAVAARPAE